MRKRAPMLSSHRLLRTEYAASPSPLMCSYHNLHCLIMQVRHKSFINSFAAINVAACPPRLIHSFNTINQYMRLIMSVRPKEPHHYLVSIGVRPEFQKKGLPEKCWIIYMKK
ncbi:hypothetical protein KL86CLO1_12322 [uncultured Eubacteriales bacterium]|uniref:Uncharacterized protein n=1 Tax=uncultured Eubacteriales bacterium TaxID=172733 RepID=A0A212K7A9_9FIRM|nr:hypothetical protein KL86CLO1_12322 [uncultured Eubacteriales bacterium]